MKRVFLIVLDSCGIGGALDAEAFGDLGTNTLKSVCTVGGARLKSLIDMGLGNIDGIDFLPTVDTPTASYARLCEASMGKDTTIGHWEIAGHISNEPLPTYPEGFPKDITDELSRRIGRGLLCNKPYSGTKVLIDYGEEHLRTGDIILYTSADSVLQLAAHTSVVPLEELYKYCEAAREISNVGRVIARPFAGEVGSFYRLAERHDYSLEPPAKMITDAVKESGLASIAVGKINDVFAGRGFTEAIPTHSNTEGMAATLDLLSRDFTGLCFVNLVDFDMVWGHRRNPEGYANGLMELDGWLPKFVAAMNEDDVLMITADHGCDPCYELTTDHTRENVPLIVYSKSITPKNLGTRNTFSDIAATVASLLSVDFKCDGRAIDLLEKK